MFRREGEGRQGLPSFMGSGTGPASQAVENSESMWPLSTGPGGTGLLLPPSSHHFRMTAGWPGVQEAQLAPRPVSG